MVLKNLSIRKKLIFSMLLICLVPFSIGIVYIKGETEKWLYQNSIIQTETILKQVARHVDESILVAMKDLISMLVLDENILNVDSRINNYTEFAPENYTYTDTISEQKIAYLFKSVVDTHNIVAFVAYGTEFGGYIEYPKFNPNSPYDPRVRDWYKNALTNDILVSEPYETKVSKELVVSINKKVIKDNHTIGVISLTIRLKDIMTEVSSVIIGDTGYVSIVSPNNIIINSPKNPDWVLKNMHEVTNNQFLDYSKFDNQSFEGYLNGSDKVFTLYISPISGWKFVSIVDKSDILKQSHSLSGLLFIISILIALIVIVFVFIVSSYITKPILTLSQIIKKMASFNFDDYEHSTIDQFSKNNDEIGEISNALGGMQLNFIELKNSLDHMDEEIKSIKIEETSIKRLNLSKDNPFIGIANSINGLLDKVSSYLETIRKYNEEISVKNDMLIASEEELIAQLDEINTQQIKINFLAAHDPLTDLPNRRSFHSRLSDTITKKTSGAVILLDMDNFKSINDTLGHIFGDKILQIVAAKLTATSQENIFISRFGGDEFLILFEMLTSGNDLDAYVKSLFDIFTPPIVIENNEIQVEFSMGISRFPDDSTSFEQIIMNADLALYHVKNSGKNHFAYFNQQMAMHLKHKLEIQSILQFALDSNGFKLVYQPQVSLKTGKIMGYEALLRLQNHNISPAEFIPIAEENGLIMPIGRKVTFMVIEQIASWLNSGLKPKPIAINFSVIQINDLKYKNFLFETLAQFNVPPELIQIEITEHIFLENKSSAISFMDALRQKGIKIAVDDFGAEYSSLSYLATLPIDTLKFDREMNLKLLNHENAEVMEKLIAFVHSLNLKIVAEGIEEQSHVQMLSLSNCDEVQGYYFSKPVDANEVEAINDYQYTI
ncbi:bifunctional diguanylate cyclase/phosphodiesterase [Fusibacter bizertensis]